MFFFPPLCLEFIQDLSEQIDYITVQFFPHSASVSFLKSTLAAGKWGQWGGVVVVVVGGGAWWVGVHTSTITNNNNNKKAKNQKWQC